MGYITKNYLKTQFNNFANRIASIFARKTDIPTKTSQLQNDSGFKTADSNTTYALSKSGNTITLTGSDGSKTSVTDSDTNTTYGNMKAATASAAGKAGLVPAPAAGKQNAYFRGDGTYVTPSTTLAGTVPGIPLDQTMGKKLNDKIDNVISSLTNENSETFNFGVLNGVRGFYTDSARGADTFIPFSGNAEIIMTNTPTYTMPEKGKYIIVVSGNIAHRPTLSVNGINKTATEETFQANFSTYTAIYELELNAGDVLSTYWYVLATIKL